MEIKKIMLVDDDPDIRTVGSMSLERVGGWEVVLAQSGQEALDKVGPEQPDLILLDVMMPLMVGPATFAKLRQDDQAKAIPIIFLTAKVQTQEVERYLAMGATGVISKPFDPVALPDEIRRISESA